MKKAYIDTSVWINAVENSSEYNRIVNEHLALLKLDGFHFCISDLVMLEILCKPIKNDDPYLISKYKSFIVNTESVDNNSNLLDSIEIIKKDKLNVMDAIHVMFAKKNNCDLFVSTDKHFRTLNSIKPYYIDLSSTGT